ncbi:MAG: NAD(P)/FAD-dependent oxidoreductase [Tannerellaceae bacterium]|jgi:phytoene dehydrogenase-like protein|nr:NAD(P)/FAD-dependent oxidoreductase [Tannerellaceae bacterium]
MNRYDVIIIGSGLGGLVCAATLSKEGYHVCVLEKNSTPGGCFQSFKRNGRLLDTGIHYIGGMDEGEVLRQYFTYFGIQEQLKLKRMDEEAFDIIRYDGEEYHYAMGYGRFVETLARRFPGEKGAIRQYVAILDGIGRTISVDQLKKGTLSTGAFEHFSTSAWERITALTPNRRLQQVLSSPALLYGGEQATSTFYHHAMITDSYLKGAYRFVDGSMQVVDALSGAIRRHGGTIMTEAEVTRLYLSGDRVQSVEVNGTERLEATHVISSIHPATTMQLVEKTPLIRKAYLSRLSGLPNSYGLLSVYLIQKKNTTPYRNHNLFVYARDNVWYNTLHPEDTAINCSLVTMQPSSADERYTDVICLLTPMYIAELRQWENTTVERRGDGYRQFKERKAREMISFVERYEPSINRHTEAVYTVTPLTYRDYTGTPDGSAYGIMKNYNQPLVTIIPNRTRIANLLLAGQNLNVHGALGVTLTSMLTCAELLGTDYLAKRIGGA